MARTNPTATAGEMLGNLKARLGFSHEGHSDEALEESSNFDDDGFSERWDDEYAGYGADYDENAPIGAFRPATTRSNRFGHPRSTPNLVSIDDVKATTPVPETLSRDPLDAQRSSPSPSSRRPSERNAANGRTSAASPSDRASAMRDSRSRSEGLDSLFEPSGAGPSAQSPSSSFDPYEAYSSKRPASHARARSLVVIRPTSYDDVEKVAKTLKAGDAVVLALQSVGDDLAKRILDFSFGVASALDAHVECPSAKVFAIACGGALTDGEKQSLKSQGV